MARRLAATNVRHMNVPDRKVVIAGGGVAALEGLMALHELAGGLAEIELVTPTPEFAYRPLAVAEPFGLGDARRFDLVRIATDHGAAVHIAAVKSVDTGTRGVATWDGRVLSYEILFVAIGAQPVTAIPGTVTIQGPGYTGRFRELLRELEAGAIRHVTFAVPFGTSWPMPLYELALMTARHAKDLGIRDVRLSLVTPERMPLQLFGHAASDTVRELLERSGIELHLLQSAARFENGRLELVPGEPLEADRAVSLPRLVGPELAGLPADTDGFIPVDLNGLVRGERDVYAAGDSTSGSIKQGGIAAQQADAAAAAIAVRLGAAAQLEPFTPVLRGMLLTGATPRYMRADAAGGRGLWEVSDHALWWPPGKIAGKRLSPYLALRHDDLEPELEGHRVDVDLSEDAAPAV
jgi:sulfide:quinone oxidoreductase